MVIVQGHESEEFTISNRVFQGTVLGPPLWNVFFEPIDAVILREAFRVAKFADDLSAYKIVEASTSNTEIKDKLASLQDRVHKWGKQSRASFDSTTKHFCILHRRNCDGDTFRLLGVMVNQKLSMSDEIDRIKSKASPKVSAILSSRWFYNEQGLIQQYKSHVLPLLEFSNASIYHAAESKLDELDEIQH